MDGTDGTGATPPGRPHGHGRRRKKRLVVVRRPINLTQEFVWDFGAATVRGEQTRCSIHWAVRSRTHKSKHAFFCRYIPAAGLQAAVDGGDEAVRAVLCLNISLRGLNVRRQPPLVSKAVGVLQKVLRETPVGEFFYAQIAQPRALRNVLREAYADPATVDDDLVDRMLQPGLRPGSAAVFLDFISYSTGPLPEDLLEKLPKEKVMFGWGTKDPWELVDMGREYYADMVREFVELEGLGHCPMDEAPQIVNPLIERFVREY